MPRKARVTIEDGYYLITARAGRGILLFNEDDDFRIFSRLCSSLLRTDPGLGLLGWCFLPDSAHLLLRGGGSGIKRFMRLLLGRYSRTRKDIRGSGRGLFGGERYHSRVFSDPSALSAVIRFIHSLPAREGFVLFADAWAWSSLRCLRSRRSPGKDELRVDSGVISGLIGGTTLLEPDPEEPEPDWMAFEITASPGSEAAPERFVPADPAAILSREYRVHRSKLINPRGREQQALRHAAFKACRDRWGMNYSEVARVFGVTPAAVINALKRLEKRFPPSAPRLPPPGQLPRMPETRLRNPSGVV